MPARPRGGHSSTSIDVTHVTGDRERATGVALILVDGCGDNLISVAPGANAAVCVDDVERAAAVLCAAEVLLVQLEVPLDAIRAAARLARD